MNQKALALKLNISIPAYSKLETDITDPNYSRIIQIAEVHGLTLKELLEVGEEKSLEAALIDELREKVRQLDGEVIKLQRKLIEMYSEQDERKKA